MKQLNRELKRETQQSQSQLLLIAQRMESQTCPNGINGASKGKQYKPDSWVEVKSMFSSANTKNKGYQYRMRLQW